MSNNKRGRSLSGSIHRAKAQSWAFAQAEQSRDSVAADSLRTRRRTTACTACRLQKLKCEMPHCGPPCTRCVRRDISCLVDRRNQALLEDHKQNELFQRDIQNLHEALRIVCQQLSVEPPRPLFSMPESQSSTRPQIVQSDTGCDEGNGDESSLLTSPSTVQAPIDTFRGITKSGRTSTGEISLHPGERQRGPQQPRRDLVGQGLVSEESADMLIQRYLTRLDDSLYSIASRYKTLEEVRKASPALLAAICTVSALHHPDGEKLYETCNTEFRRIVSTSLFGTGDIEYLRALCIGSFWLADDSRILISDAVRRAADMRLHKYFYQVINADKSGVSTPELVVSREEARDRIRLWYIIFICDQHLSVLHDRDGLLRHEKNILEMGDSYLTSEGGNETDTRILSQVSTLLILNAMRDTFGSDHPEQVHKSLLVQLNHFSLKLNEWSVKIGTWYSTDPRIGAFPKAGIDMHLQFGKLYLGHYVFRGLGSDPIPLHFLPAAKMASQAARSIFEMILSNASLRESLVGRPHYVFIMISFAGHFLLEVCQKFSEQLAVDAEETFNFMDEVLTVLSHIEVIPQHPISRMASGLRRKAIACASDTWRRSCLNRISGPRSQPASNEVTLSNTLYPTGSIFESENADMSIPTQFYFSAGHIPMGSESDQYWYTDYDVFNFPGM